MFIILSNRICEDFYKDLQVFNILDFTRIFDFFDGRPLFLLNFSFLEISF